MLRREFIAIVAALMVGGAIVYWQAFYDQPPPRSYHPKVGCVQCRHYSEN